MILLLQSLIMLFFAASPAYQDTSPQKVYEEKAEKILREASEEIKSHESLYIRFDFIVTNTEPDLQEQTDAWLYTKGDKYFMKVGYNQFISDGVTVWSFLEEVNEVHISMAEDAGETITPTSLLENFTADFRSKWIREERDGDKNVHIIDLVPNEPHAFFKYRVAIDDLSRQIRYTEAYDRQGGTYRYEITAFDPNPEIPENQFFFDPDQYPGIEVVDLR